VLKMRVYDGLAQTRAANTVDGVRGKVCCF
jgi:hypothetical protein